MDDRARPGARRDALTTAPSGPAIPGDESLDVLAGHGDDEDAAAEARSRYRLEPMASLDPDPLVAPFLCPDERLLAVRRRAILDRRQPQSGSVGPGLVGDLYLTSARLLHVGRLTLIFGLEEIEEAVLAGNRLLLVMREGTGISLEVHRPRLLRVEIATARAAARR